MRLFPKNRMRLFLTNPNSPLILLGLLVAAIGVSGCSGTAVIKQDYADLQHAKRSAAIYVKEMQDVRPAGAQGVIGGVFNGYNIRMGDVKEPASLKQDLSASLRQALQASGYTLSSDDRDLVMEIILKQISCDFSAKGGSSIVTAVKLTDKGETVLEKTYSGDAKVGFFEMDMTCSNTLNSSVKKLVTAIVADVNEYLTT